MRRAESAKLLAFMMQCMLLLMYGISVIGIGGIAVIIVFDSTEMLVGSFGEMVGLVTIWIVIADCWAMDQSWILLHNTSISMCASGLSCHHCCQVVPLSCFLGVEW